MDYQSIITRNKEIFRTDKCLHGLDKVSCGFCNGYSTKKEKVKAFVNMDSEILNRYEELKTKFRNYKELWNEDEFFVVYANLKDSRGTKEELKAIYRTAIELSRTKGAIRWAMEHLFSQKEYHRGKVAVEFRKMFGLDKGI